MKRATVVSHPKMLKIVSLDSYQELSAPKLPVRPKHNPPLSDRASYQEGRLAISTPGKIDMVEVAEILFVKAESNYVRIWLKGKISYMMAKTLKQVSPGLERCGFIRVHQSYIVHPSMIRSYHSSEGKILLRSGDEIPVSRVNRKKVTHQLMLWA